jgi:hypothetical protein
MGRILSNILHSRLEQSLWCLLIVTRREILTLAHQEDCLNNAWARGKQDGIYGPDTEISFCSEGRLRAWNTPRLQGRVKLNEISGHMITVHTLLQNKLKAAHRAYHGAGGKEEGET